MSTLADQVGQNTRRLDGLEMCLHEVGNAVLGTRRSNFAGGDREENGLIHTAAAAGLKMDDISLRLRLVEERISNGGIRIRLHPAILAFLGLVAAAVIGGVATVIAAGIGG